MKFYKRDPDRALAGMADLTLQERGAYNTILDALYSRDGVLRADDEMLRRLLGCHGNEYRAVKAKLIGCGKIWIEAGYVKAKGVESTLEAAQDKSEKARKTAGKRWQIERKNRNNIIKSTSDGMLYRERYKTTTSEYASEECGEPVDNSAQQNEHAPLARSLDGAAHGEQRSDSPAQEIEWWEQQPDIQPEIPVTAELLAILNKPHR